MADQLTPLDATFLELEDADESAHMHIGGLLVFEPVGGGGAPPLDAVCEHLAGRIAALPRYTQRLSDRHTSGLHWPEWVHDERFDMSAHVRRAALPAPGGEDELMEWAGDYWSHRLDRRRPLWEIVVVEGLEGGRWAMCTKTHHCMVDGVGSVDAAHLLLDVSPEPSEPPRRGLPAPGRRPGWIARHAPDAVVHAAERAAKVALHPRQALHSARGLAEVLVRDELIAAPRSSLNVPIGTARRYRSVRVPVGELKAVKRELGGTLNDVVLAVVAGGMRRLLLERGEDPPPRGLRAMVPVNVRAGAEQLELGNRITSLFLHLPVAEPEPLQRYAAARAEAAAGKSGRAGDGAAALLDVTGQLPPVAHSLLARSMYASRLFNVTVTNVPGPQLSLYAFGARMLHADALVPLAAEHAVGVAVLSYDGELSFGLIADRDAVPDIDVLARGIAASIEELRLITQRDGGVQRMPEAAARATMGS